MRKKRKAKSLHKGNVERAGISEPSNFSEEGTDNGLDALARLKGCNKCCNNVCEEINCTDNNVNLRCASEKELLIRIYCLLKSGEYGLKAIEQKMKKSQLNDDLKNIKSISDLLERAIVGLGETAVGAVKKAVDAAGTMSDLTSGLAKIAAGSAQTAGSLASTASGLATVSSGAAGTAGGIAFTSSGLANTAAGTAGTLGAAANTTAAVANTTAAVAGTAAAAALTVGAIADIAGELTGLAAAGAASAGAIADIAGELTGIASAGAASAGAIADIAGELTGIASTAAASAGAIGDIAGELKGLAAAGAATTGTLADITTEAAGIAAAGAATAGALADITAETAGIAAAGAATAGTLAELAKQGGGTGATGPAQTTQTTQFAQTTSGISDNRETISTGMVKLNKQADTLQVWLLNNTAKASKGIEINAYYPAENTRSRFYSQNTDIPAGSAVNLSIALLAETCEVEILNLERSISAFIVSVNNSRDNSAIKNPIEAGILLMQPSSMR